MRLRAPSAPAAAQGQAMIPYNTLDTQLIRPPFDPAV